MNEDLNPSVVRLSLAARERDSSEVPFGCRLAEGGFTVQQCIAIPLFIQFYK